MKKLIALLLSLAGTCFAQLQGPPQPFTGSLTAASASCLASNCLTVTVPADASTLTIQLTGTWSATVQFEVSADNQATWQGINAQPIPNGQQVTSATGNGVWQADVAGFTNARLRVSAFSSGTVVAQASLVFGITGITSQPVDPCASAAIAKSSKSIAISSSTTTVIQAGATGKTVFVCAFTLVYASGTTPTAQFEFGTGGTCTSPTVLTGAMNLQATAGTALIAGAGHTLFAGASGADVCLVSTGTTPTYNGWVTFVLM